MNRFLVAAIALAGLGAAGLIGWNNGIHDYFFPRAFRTVEPNAVYASGQINRRLIGGVIDQYHIGRIVSLTDDGPAEPDEAAEREAAREKGVEYFVFPLNGDGTGDIGEYEKTLVVVTQAESQHVPILVHCYSGAQRTRGWIAFYRLLVEHRPADQVKEELTDGWKEPANPKLYPYLNEHMEEVAKFLVARGIIPSPPLPMPRLDP
jgi:protein tyrosine phosphatase (PTP) superfamily phosphohydrolase (DUF442 family)